VEQLFTGTTGLQWLLNCCWVVPWCMMLYLYQWQLYLNGSCIINPCQRHGPIKFMWHLESSCPEGSINLALLCIIPSGGSEVNCWNYSRLQAWTKLVNSWLPHLPLWVQLQLVIVRLPGYLIQLISNTQANCSSPLSLQQPVSIPVGHTQFFWWLFRFCPRQKSKKQLSCLYTSVL